MNQAIGYLLAAMCILKPALAEDWPEWRGKGRGGIWIESGILDKFPEKGLTAAWRTPIHSGFAGPAVAAGRVFVTDFERSAGTKGTERTLCLDEKSGKIVWAREWDADYQGISYAQGRVQRRPLMATEFTPSGGAVGYSASTLGLAK